MPVETTVRAEIELELEPGRAFDLLADELGLGLERLGLRLEPGADGRVTEGGTEVGRVTAWEPGRRLAFAWRPAEWTPDDVTEVELSLEPKGAATRVLLEHRGWGRVLDDPGELGGWFAGEVLAPLLAATAPGAFGEWVTDRGARRPSGERARGTFRDPLYHRPNFAVILEALALTQADHLLEVGCGGGAFLHDALRSGCRASAIDHSPDMVRLAREVNGEAVAQGRLEVLEADAARLPFADESFTCATMTGVLGFLPDPVSAFGEIRRVLVPGGRFVALGSDPAWRATPAAPEPFASRLRFYNDAELEALARAVGFGDVRVERRSLAAHARATGIPTEHLGLFEQGDAPFLLARKG